MTKPSKKSKVKKIRAWGVIRTMTGLLDTFGDIRSNKSEANSLKTWAIGRTGNHYEVRPVIITILPTSKKGKKK